MAVGDNRRFRYKKVEIGAIEATLLSSPIDRAVDLDYLETCAETYLHRVARGSAALPAKRINKERDDRDRTVERVRHSIKVRKQAEHVSAFIDGLVADDSSLSRTRLLAQAMFEGKINEWDLRGMLARDLLSDANRLEWPGQESWLHADGRQKDHRASYINDLVCFWAEGRGVRPDEVGISPGESCKGNRLMDFILAAGTRPMREAGELIGPERVMDIVQELKTYWAGRHCGENLE